MLKNLFKRWLGLLLVALMVLPLLPQGLLTVQAAESTKEFPGVTVTGDFTESGSGIICKAVAEEVCAFRNEYKATEKKLTLTNTRDVAGVLKFQYTIAVTGGSVTVEGENKTGSGQFTLDSLAAGGSITITINSGPNKNNNASITLTDIRLLVDEMISTTFLPADNGGYTVDGTSVTAQTITERSSLESYTLKATPAEGYKFVGWYGDGKLIGKSANWTVNMTQPQAIAPRFVLSSAPVFLVGKGNEFYDLPTAVAFAQENDQSTIILVGDGVLSAGEYTIPDGITLLIPYNDTYTLCTNEPVFHANDSNASSAKAYKTLTMASGAHITVQSGGAISVSARAQNTTPNAGVVLGPWGMISMESDSSIVVESGANLYCWGFITGQGSVLAKSGSTVYENFQVTSFRGGNASASMNGGNKNKVFPFTQFYIQNIEVPMTMEAGALETVCIGVTMSVVGLQKGSGTLVGQDDGLFRLQSGKMTKRYDGATDRLMIEVDGDAQISEMTVKMGSAGNIESSKYVVPITNNMTVHVHSGHSLGIQYDMAMLPGSQMLVDDGADLTLAEGKNFYIYDQEEWIGKGYADGYKRNFDPLVNVPGRSYKRTDADLTDALLDINGTMAVNGALYTTAGGANVTSSSGTGQIVFNSAAGTATVTHQVVQSGNTVEPEAVSIAPARLRNTVVPDDAPEREYSQTASAAANDTFAVLDGVWHKNLTETERAHYPHTPGEATRENEVAATCVTEGSYEEISACTVCGEEIRETKTIPALGHEYAFDRWGEWMRAEDGSYTIAANLVCQREDCPEDSEGHTKAETEAVTVSKEVVNPTCTEDGTATYTASITIGGETYTTEPYTVPAASALGHSYDEGKITTPATCVATGVKTYTCTRCGETKTEEAAIDPKNHTDVQVDEAKEPTCTETGLTEGSHCEACKAVIQAQEMVPTSSHTYDEPAWDWTKAENGEWTAAVVFTCDQCNDVQTPRVTVTKKVTNATCTTDGVIVYTAATSFAGKEYTDTKEEVITAEGHTSGAAVREHEVAATCTAEGSYDEVVYCTVCKAKISREKKAIPVIAHTLTATAAKAATCTEAGNIAYWTCEACHGVFSDTAGKNPVTQKDTVIKALGHTPSSPVHENEVAPTCTADGSYDAVVLCAVCNHEISRETVTVSALGHSLVQHKAQAATCTQDGWEDYETCSRCEYTTYQVIPALEHSYDEGKITTPATCTEDGEKTFTCIRGDDSYTERIPAVGHRYGDPVWEWLEDADGSWTARVSFSCGNCDDVQIPEVTVTEETHDATCTGEGLTIYSAEAEFDGETYRAIKDDIVLSPTGHVYGTPHWEWTDDGAFVTFTCGNCGDKQEIDAEVDEVTEEATCTQDGAITYIARATFDEQEYTDTRIEILPAAGHMAEVDAEIAATCTEPGLTEGSHCAVCGEVLERQMEIPATGHDWGEGEITTPATCTQEGERTYVCAHDAGHVRTETVEKAAHPLVSVEAAAATCLAEGHIAYWKCAACEALFDSAEDGRQIGLIDTVIPAIGHSYGKPEFLWTQNDQGGWTATAEFTCQACQEETAVNAAVSVADTKAPDCTQAGTRVFTATASLTPEGDIHTDTKEVTLPALGHEYQESWQWGEENASATLVLTCAKDKNHTEAIAATITTQTTPATTKAAGKTVYTASAVFADKTYTDTRETTIPRLPTSSGGGGGGGRKGGGSSASIPVVVQPPVVPAETEIPDTNVPLTEAPLQFKDVKEDNWFYHPVEYVFRQGIMNGTSEMEFTPAGVTTRGTIATMLYRLEESPVAMTAADFSDVEKGAWYAEAVDWAADCEIVAGYGNGAFGPGDAITREQLAAMIYRYAKFNGLDTSIRADLDKFTDKNSISDWAVEAVSWAVGTELLQGDGANLNPVGTATRAEAATILMRLHQMVK